MRVLLLQSLRNPEGRPYNTMDYSLQLSADGNVVLVPRSGQSGSAHYSTRSSMDPAQQQQQHHHHPEHKE
jgi:hypothetical protein